MQSVKNIPSLRNKRVLVRVDFNVPIEKGKVADDSRIRAALPTIKFLIKEKAKLILVTHFTRSKKPKEIKVVSDQLSKLLKKKVQLIDKWDFDKIAKSIKKIKAGQVLILPNVRLHSGEEKNSQAFAEQLAGLAQIYVNEAFAVDHRKHASLVGVPQLLPSYAGLTLMQEIAMLECVVKKPQKPFVALMGGAKVKDKLALIKTMLKKANVVLIGGSLSTHFFKAAGYGIGASKTDPQGVKLAKSLLKSKKIILPRDIVAGNLKKPNGSVWVVEVAKGKPYALCSKPYSILDVGPQTILEFARHLKTAQTLIWNGPTGFYEIKRFSHGTMALGRLFASRSKGRAFGVVGGGETVDALKKTGLEKYVDWVSTGGGAMLEFLAGKKLPGIEALK